MCVLPIHVALLHSGKLHLLKVTLLFGAAWRGRIFELRRVNVSSFLILQKLIRRESDYLQTVILILTEHIVHLLNFSLHFFGKCPLCWHIEND